MEHVREQVRRVLCHVFMRTYVFRTSFAFNQGGLSQMRQRLIGLIAIAVFALILPGCGDNGNKNANTNANRNANLAASPTLTPANTNANTNRALTREEYERNKEQYNREAKQSGRTVGTGLNDGWLWVKTRFDLAAANDLRDSTINVDVENAVVTLSGTVASAAQKAKAEQVAKTVEGVKSVKNMLKVAPDTNTNTANRNKNANSNTNHK